MSKIYFVLFYVYYYFCIDVSQHSPTTSIRTRSILYVVFFYSQTDVSHTRKQNVSKSQTIQTMPSTTKNKNLT